MDNLIKPKYVKYFYLSDFSVSFALGMIPLMTVLSYLISSLSTSTFLYALILALYNVSTTLPKVYVVKKLSNKKNTFESILKIKVVQILIWLSISLVFFTLPNTSTKILIFCGLYLLYAFTKGSIEVLSIDVYSKIMPSKSLGKFFGYKYALNSMGEFIGAMTLVSFFNFLNIDMNYGIIFMLVFILDTLSFAFLFRLKNVIHLRDCESVPIKSKASLIVPQEVGLDLKSLNILKRTYLEIRDVLLGDPIFKSFIIANTISIVGASVASFFIPYGTSELNLALEQISIANAVWLISRVLSSVFWGYVVDFIGAKYTMVGSRLALLISYYIAITLDSVEMFYLMLIFHGISSSALVVMAQNIFIEISKENSALYAAINSVICMPFFVVTPLIASYLSESVGYAASFAISMIPLVVSLLLMLKVKLIKK